MSSAAARDQWRVHHDCRNFLVTLTRDLPLAAASLQLIVHIRGPVLRGGWFLRRRDDSRLLLYVLAAEA